MLGDVDTYNAMVTFYNMAFAIAMNHKERDDTERNRLDDEFEKLSDVCSAKIQADLQTFASKDR